MTPAHVVQSGAGRARRYLASIDGRPDAPPFSWIGDAGRALTFPSPAEARAFALAALGHALFEIGPAPILIEA